MALLSFIRERQWCPLIGYLLFLGMMTVGHYYNITLIQLGLVDLGRRVLGMGELPVAANMSTFAVITCITAIAVGYGMMRSG